MKKVYIILTATLLIASFIKCKPAAEDRFKMHENAKRVSDSIGKVIDDAMAEVVIPGTESANKNAANLPPENGVIVKLEGDGMKKSAVFTLTGKTAKLKYKFKSSGKSGFLAVYIVEENVDLDKSGGTPELMSQKSEESESVIHKAPGRYYLSVNGAGNWSVTVTEE